jgi:hypothetical protein
VLPRRWAVERTNAWQNAHKKLVWCTEGRGRVIDFWIAFSNVIIVGRLSITFNIKITRLSDVPRSIQEYHGWLKKVQLTQSGSG